MRKTLKQKLRSSIRKLKNENNKVSSEIEFLRDYNRGLFKEAQKYRSLSEFYKNPVIKVRKDERAYPNIRLDYRLQDDLGTINLGYTKEINANWTNIGCIEDEVKHAFIKEFVNRVRIEYGD